MGMLVAVLVAFHVRMPQLPAQKRQFVWRNLALMAIQTAAAFYVAAAIHSGSFYRWPKRAGSLAVVGAILLALHAAMRFARVRNAVYHDDYDTRFEKVAWIILGSVFGILFLYALVT